MHKLELLAPAKDLATAREAILHGADAVYLGAPKFGARQAASVSLEDIAVLTQEAHLFGVKVYIALNTILFDSELAEAESLIHRLYHVGVDAVIIQDMGITEMNLPPIALHASTQCHNSTSEKLTLLEQLGFEQAVLARELNPAEIARIRECTCIRLEVFVHGAVCVSYSGRCYLSEAIKGRSANRGACAQMCRQTYDLVDAEGTYIYKEKYLLSAKDMNRSESLEDLVLAGVTSFKIEGRLKGVSYVKNVTACYSRLLDEIIKKYPDRYERSSKGICKYLFEPDLNRCFNRGYTNNYFHTATPDRPNDNIVNINTPKSTGEFAGVVKKCIRGLMVMNSVRQLHNADGLIFILPDGSYEGSAVNKILSGGNIELNKRLNLPSGTQVYRNYDHQFEQILSKPSATRKIPVDLVLRSLPFGLVLDISDGTNSTSTSIEFIPEKAKNFRPDAIKEILCRQGDTVFEVRGVTLALKNEPFIPPSLLTRLRRDAIRRFEMCLKIMNSPRYFAPTLKIKEKAGSIKSGLYPNVGYEGNVSNRLAQQHYRKLGASDIQPAFELLQAKDAALMTTKHCFRRLLGYCTRETLKRMPYKEPLFLIQGNERFQIKFDCKNCLMRIILKL
ncbi:Uncharacterized protease yhbU precursor [Porphyromonas macacae]|uniref:Uncharacterized protease yhbU n=1 Tax=Porphyromonas macacae TaxID=28115 RepID=A0A379E992_9PORP|nr:U32 family peptidase [Porphyromonas macacae]SUB88921.1 Uncharacterized protease yhbU precursor [Porphyromonas macacae]